MIKFNSSEIIILKELFNSNSKLSVYTLHRKYKLSPFMLNKSLKKLKNKNFIHINELTITLTKKGKTWILNNNNYLYVNEKPWRKCPKEFLKPALAINKPYIPMYHYLDSTFEKSNLE